MLMYIYSLISFFFSSLLMFLLSYKHFLVMLLSLEAMVLSIYTLMLMYFSYFIYEYFMCMFFLSISVCESALGLSLLVLVIRTHGSDMIMMFDMLW